MAYGWEGERIRLAPLEPERHLDNAVRWLNDPRVTEWLLIGDHPITRVAEQKFFDQVSDTEIVFAIETLDGRHLGMSGIHHVNYRDGTAMTGSFIGSVEDWGKGFGTEASQVRAYYAFEVLGLRQLRSGHLGGNLRSSGMLRRTGYVEVGCYPRRHWKRGAYRDSHLYVLEADVWRANRQP